MCLFSLTLEKFRHQCFELCFLSECCFMKIFIIFIIYPMFLSNLVFYTPQLFPITYHMPMKHGNADSLPSPGLSSVSPCLCVNTPFSCLRHISPSFLLKDRSPPAASRAGEKFILPPLFMGGNIWLLPLHSHPY